MSIFDRIRGFAADTGSHNSRIARGFLWVSFFVLIGKIAGAAKEMTIAWRYGVNETVDAYVFVFNLVNWPVSVWFSVLTVVLVPLVAQLRHDNPREIPCFHGELLGLTLIIGLGLGILAWLGLPVILQAQWLGLPDKALTEALQMSGGLSLLIPMGALISFLSAWMLAYGRHRNTLFEAIPAITILAALLSPPSWLHEPLLWGTVAGCALHTIALAASLRQRNELQAPSFTFNSPAWQGFWSSVSIMALGQVLMSFTTIIDQFFAADLGPGALSTLSYANRILALILGMGAMAISRATLPIFSEANAQNSADVNSLALSWAKRMFIMGLVVVVIGGTAAPWIVGLLFERGAFTTSNTDHVSIVFRYALVQFPLYAFALTLVSLMASQKKYGIIFISGMVGIIVKILAAAILVPFMQLKGLVLSAVPVYLANGILFYYFLRK